jgi:hypothetical protein
MVEWHHGIPHKNHKKGIDVSNINNFIPLRSDEHRIVSKNYNSLNKEQQEVYNNVLQCIVQYYKENNIYKSIINSVEDLKEYY